MPIAANSSDINSSLTGRNPPRDRKRSPVMPANRPPCRSRRTTHRSPWPRGTTNRFPRPSHWTTSGCADDHAQIDFLGRFQLTDRFSLVLELVNLTDEPYRVFEGTPDRPRQEEYYSWWGVLGVRFDL